ncbi:MAG: hypothetical protein KGJ57_21290 [Sphingomonadales bacterium]|nr:hypothetical protein [Sphingomonadales bacterium]MDE2171928.1 hypothetical protein [Sphingomonadales bacterium]
MGTERQRIDRRLTAITQVAGTVPAGPVALFQDAWGRTVQRFDFAEIGLPMGLIVPFAEAFRGHYAPMAKGTRMQGWKAMKVFARFVSEDSMVSDLGDLTSELFGRYILWLDASRNRMGQPRSPGSRYNQYQPVKLLTEWIARHHAELMPVRPSFPFNPFPNRHEVQGRRRPLSAKQLQDILLACYEEIDTAWALFEEGQRILAAPGDRDDADSLPAMLRKIHELGHGIMPEAKDLPRRLMRQLHLNGGHDRLEQYLHATARSLAPFYVALAIQTAGNPEALRLIDRDCIEPHPLIEHRIMIDWRKARAGHLLKQAQRRSFDNRRRYAVPNLIEKLLAMTAPLVMHAPPAERNHLFLMRRPGRPVSVIQRTTLEVAVSRFVKNADKRIAAWNEVHPDLPREKLPSFCMMLFRRSVAFEHYRASGGDVRVAQNILNHSSAALTDRYIQNEQAQKIQHETMVRLQRLMLQWVHASADTPEPTMGEAAETFGHRCLAPMVGPAKPCPYFGGCLACPGLVVPIDTAHLARILLAIEHLGKARMRLTPERWMLLYKPSYDVLTQDILPDFPAAMHASARKMMALLPDLPELE